MQERLRCAKIGSQNSNQTKNDERDVHVVRDQNRKGQSQNQYINQKDKKKRITNVNVPAPFECNNNYSRKNRSTSPDPVGVSSTTTTSNVMMNHSIAAPIIDYKPTDNNNSMMNMNSLIMAIEDNQAYYRQPSSHNDDLTTAYHKALAEIATVGFNSNLRYTYWTDETMTKYYCKVILFEENFTLLRSYWWWMTRLMNLYRKIDVLFFFTFFGHICGYGKQNLSSLNVISWNYIFSRIWFDSHSTILNDIDFRSCSRGMDTNGGATKAILHPRWTRRYSLPRRMLIHRCSRCWWMG